MNAIINAFAYIENYETSENLDKCNDLLNIYMRCCCVSLISAKYNGNAQKDCRLVLVSNIDIPSFYKNIFDKEGIIVKKMPFDNFIFNGDMKWSLAFYKICALKKIVESGEYDKVMLVDSDTYFSYDINDLWIEADYGNILLYDICHNIKNRQSVQMNKEYKQLYNKDVLLVNYGGEFVCGRCDILKPYLEECENIYNDMIKNNATTLHGDEFIWSSAAIKFKETIKAANGYIDRYWTGRRMYRVSTNYYYDPVYIYHFPVEKKYGIKKTFNYYIKHNKFPNLRKLRKWFSLPSINRNCLIKDVLKFFRKI